MQSTSQRPPALHGWVLKRNKGLFGGVGWRWLTLSLGSEGGQVILHKNQKCDSAKVVLEWGPTATLSASISDGRRDVPIQSSVARLDVSLNPPRMPMSLHWVTLSAVNLRGGSVEDRCVIGGPLDQCMALAKAFTNVTARGASSAASGRANTTDKVAAENTTNPSLSSTSAEIVSLRDELAAAQAESATASATVLALESKIDDLKRQIEELRTARDAALSSEAAAKAARDIAATERDAAIAAEASALAARDAAMDDKIAAQSLTDATQTEVSLLKTQLQSAAIDTLQLGALSSSLAHSEALLDSERNARLMAESSAAEARSAIAQLSIEIKEAQEARYAAEARIDSLAACLASEKAQSIEVANALTALQAEAAAERALHAQNKVDPESVLSPEDRLRMIDEAVRGIKEESCRLVAAANKEALEYKNQLARAQATLWHDSAAHAATVRELEGERDTLLDILHTSRHDLSQLQACHTAAMSSIRENHEAELAKLKSDSTRELESIRMQHASDLGSPKATQYERDARAPTTHDRSTLSDNRLDLTHLESPLVEVRYAIPNALDRTLLQLRTLVVPGTAEVVEKAIVAMEISRAKAENAQALAIASNTRDAETQDAVLRMTSLSPPPTMSEPPQIYSQPIATQIIPHGSQAALVTKDVSKSDDDNDADDDNDDEDRCLSLGSLVPLIDIFRMAPTSGK